jgi:hypothetical protein
MTLREAEIYVCSHSDDEDLSEVEEVFSALYGREPDTRDCAEGLWNHCCAAVSQVEVCEREGIGY